jgi:hypothetical protein
VNREEDMSNIARGKMTRSATTQLAGRSRLTIRRASRTVVAIASLSALNAVTACDGLLDAELPGSVTVETLDNPALAPTLVVSAVSAFECAFSNYVNETSLLTHELHHSSGFLAVRTWSQRRIVPTSGDLTGSCSGTYGFGSFRTLHTARYLAEDTYARIQAWEGVANRELLLATAAAYEGYSLALLGEGYCEMTINGGPLMSPSEVLEVSEARFTTAIEHATAAGDQDILNMARVGRARVRLNLRKLADAAADALGVPVGFVRAADRGTEQQSRYNKVWLNNNGNRHTTVDPAFRNLQWKGVPDPRVQVVDGNGFGNDQSTPFWFQTKYPQRGSVMPIATWEEAQLIVAEASGGQTAVDVINRLHAAANLPPFDPATDGDVTAQIREERRRELWIEGHRLNDMLRFDIPFPEGVDHTNQPYGPTTCMPLPITERTGNPNISD